MRSRSSVSASERSPDVHARMLARLAERLTPFEADGFEHHLFLLGGEVLKVYRWFRTADQSLEMELAARRVQQLMHRVYAPALAARVVAIDADGEISDPESGRACCFALAMKRGAELPDTIWRSPDALRWSRKIGEAVAGCHRRAPEAESDAEAEGDLEALMREACELADLADLIGRTPPPPPSDRARPPAKLVHGDLHVGNVVLIEGRIQFLDPGVALPEGVGVTTRATFDAGWDVALMAQSLALFAGEEASAELLRAYGAPPSGLRYWRTLAAVLTLGATLRFWNELADPERPFALRRIPGFQLEDYARWLHARAIEPER